MAKGEKRGKIPGRRRNTAMLLPILLLLLLPSSHAFWILPNDGSFPYFVRSPQIRFMGPEAPVAGWDLNAPLLYSEELDPPPSLISGSVLIYGLHPGQSQENAARRLKSSGIVALITLLRTSSNFPGYGNWVKDGTDPINQPFPLFEITVAENNTLATWFQNQTNGVLIHMGSDTNPWDSTFGIGVPIVGIFIISFSGVIAILAAWKYILLVQKQGFSLKYD